MRRTVQDRGERHVCHGPEEPRRSQALAGALGRRQAAEAAAQSTGLQQVRQLLETRHEAAPLLRV